MREISKFVIEKRLKKYGCQSIEIIALKVYWEMEIVKVKAECRKQYVLDYVWEVLAYNKKASKTFKDSLAREVMFNIRTSMGSCESSETKNCLN